MMKAALANEGDMKRSKSKERDELKYASSCSISKKKKKVSK